MYRRHENWIPNKRQDWELKILKPAAEAAGIDLDIALLPQRSRIVRTHRDPLIVELHRRGLALNTIAFLVGFSSHVSVINVLERLNPPHHPSTNPQSLAGLPSS